MGYKPTRPQVMKYLVSHSGKPITIDDIMSATDLEKKQVQDQMRVLKNEGHNIQVLSKAAVWIYTAEPEKPEESDEIVGSLFTCIGRSKKGFPILQDETGNLYLAKEVDL